MPADVMLLVLFGAALHAGWNALVKAGADKLLDMVAVAVGSALLCAACVPFLPIPARESWPCIAASVVIHVGYFALVAAAYRAGEMSVAYPLMRGTAPLIVAGLSGMLLGEALSPGGWAGVALISGGVLAFAVPRRGGAAPGGGRALALALGNAAVIAGYTLVDGLGARLSGHAAAYTLWLLLLAAPPLLVYARLRRPEGLGVKLMQRWRVAALGGICTTASYTLALWAMTRAPIATVAALRETSILFAMLLASVALKERFGLKRHAAAAAIACGAAMLRLA
ncbi:EamA family transporter [Elioraea tepidiphila]|uniref:EamA family transporter n=1 Tax=Elioraea tepidiphila TaxID=457934 RepID=UPI00037E0542|nr:EamA family transporter [Elioraea tepidiphila]